MTTEILNVKDLWLDANQGENRDGNAFGYVGTNEEYKADGETHEFCGWFFDWPSSKAKITTEAERQAMRRCGTTTRFLTLSSLKS